MHKNESKQGEMGPVRQSRELLNFQEIVQLHNATQYYITEHIY